MEHCIVKLSLQVIIENFIVHGLRDDDIANRIEVSSERKAEFVQISIRDNGVGMGQERLAEVRDSLSQLQTGSKSFGLRSVYQRLVYLYGDDCTMDLNSRLGEGTTVTIRMPYMKGEI